jgi:hypothetical protein
VWPLPKTPPGLIEPEPRPGIRSFQGPLFALSDRAAEDIAARGASDPQQSCEWKLAALDAVDGIIDAQTYFSPKHRVSGGEERTEPREDPSEHAPEAFAAGVRIAQRIIPHTRIPIPRLRAPRIARVPALKPPCASLMCRTLNQSSAVS